MRGSRMGVRTTSSVENSYLINSHNKSLKTGLGLPYLEKQNYPSPPPKINLDPRMQSTFSSWLLKFFSFPTEGSWTGGLWSNRKDNEHHSCIWRSRVYSHQQEIFPTIPNGWSRQENTTNCKLSIRTYIHV